MADIKQRSAPPDLNDPAQVMAILRNASHQLKLADARVADAEKRAAEAKEQLAGALENGRAAQDSTALKEAERRAAEAEAEAQKAEGRAAEAQAEAQKAEGRAVYAEERLVRALDERREADDRGARDIEEAERRAAEAGLPAQIAEETLRRMELRAEQAEERAAGIERRLSTSRRRFRVALASVAGVAALGVLSSGYLAVHRPAPQDPALPLVVAEAKPAKPTELPEKASVVSVLDRLGPPRTVKTLKLPPQYDEPQETQRAAAPAEARAIVGVTEPLEAPPNSLAGAGPSRTRPKREAAAER